MSCSRSRIYQLLNQGLHHWTNEQPYEAHEPWEEAWKLRTAERPLFQGLIHIAAAAIKSKHNNAYGFDVHTTKACKRFSALIKEQKTMLGLNLVEIHNQIATAKVVGHVSKANMTAIPPRSYQSGILYLHGLASGPKSNKAKLFKQALSEHYPIRIPDLNSPSFTELTITRALNTLEGLLFEKTIIVGSSLGGYLAALLSLRHSQKIEALVLMAPAFDIKTQLTRYFGLNEMKRWEETQSRIFDHYTYNRKLPLKYNFIADCENHPFYPKLTKQTYILGALNDEIISIDSIHKAIYISETNKIQLTLTEDDHSLSNSVNLAIEATKSFAKAHF